MGRALPVGLTVALALAAGCVGKTRIASVNSADIFVIGDTFGGVAISADGRIVAFGSSARGLVPEDAGVDDDVYVRVLEAGLTQRVSVGLGGAEPDGGSRGPSLSEDGRWVAFTSFASNLVPDDLNGDPAAFTGSDAFVYDRALGATERASVSSSGAEAVGESGACGMSAGGRWVAFVSDAANLVPDDGNGARDVFVRDRMLGTTERASLTHAGLEAAGGALACALSADGRYVAFSSDSDDLVPDDANGRTDVFVRDRMLGTTERASVSSDGAEADGDSGLDAISADGGAVVFTSRATNLVPGDANGAGPDDFAGTDVFVRDRAAGATERVSVATGGAESVRGSSRALGGVSGDGRFVAFVSDADDLVPGDTNGAGANPRWGTDVFVRDRAAGATERASLSFDDKEGHGFCFDLQCFVANPPALSADGRYVAFNSLLVDLVPFDLNLAWDVFVRDRGPRAP